MEQPFRKLFNQLPEDVLTAHERVRRAQEIMRDKGRKRSAAEGYFKNFTPDQMAGLVHEEDEASRCYDLAYFNLQFQLTKHRAAIEPILQQWGQILPDYLAQ